MIHIYLLILFLFFASGCNTLSYYGQAMSGHVSLMVNSEPVDEVLKSPSTRVELQQQLLLAREIIRFSDQEMRLPSHGSYQHYVKVDGRYVVWNVIAAPALSVEARQWCYPFAGCVTYRGYYAEEEAIEYASELNKEGMDTAVAGASAYSTLGWLDDPLFSSMMYKDEARLVEVIIHELAHQRLYVSGNTVFNESFASVVAREGVRRWFKRQGKSPLYQSYLQDQKMEHHFNKLLLSTRERLQQLYTSNQPEQFKLTAKQGIFTRMQTEFEAMKSSGLLDGRYDKWMGQGLNNANLALVAAYHQMEPELEALLRAVDGDMERFYQRAQQMGEALDEE